MKWVLASPFLAGVLLFGAPHVLAVITNGSNAVNMFGQHDDSLSAPAAQYNKAQTGYSRGNDGPNKLGLYYPHGVYVHEDEHKLFVSDSDNHRILVYDLDAGNEILNRIPDYVIGQSNLATGQNNLASNRLERPYAITGNANNLFVADELNNRVLVFDVLNISNGMSAQYVLGQPDMTTDSTGTTDSKMNDPTGLAIDASGNRLFVADTGNNRVLVYDITTLSDGMAAAFVLGQANFTSNGTGLTDATMDSPYGLAYDPTNTRLYVADADNNRVLVFNVDSGTMANGASAINVLGQANFTSNTGATSQGGLFYPRGLAFDDTGDRLFVASGSHRVTVYAVDAITDGENATAVLGQSNFTNSNQVTTQSGFRGTSQIAFDSTNNYLYVVDQFNHRVLQFDVTAIGNGENATDVIGQYDGSLSAPAADYTKGYPDNGPSKLGFWGPQVGAAIDTVNNRLFVSDSFNNRVLVFNLNASNQLIERIPDNVLGQSTFTSSGVSVTSAGMNKPRGMVLDQANSRLFVADSLNNRVLVFNVASISDGEAAVSVLGQTTFTASGAATTQAGMSRPIGITYRASDQTLFVGDRLNHRILTYDVNSITNGENAQNVIGQTDFVTATTGITQAKFDIPYGLAHDTTRNVLYVSDFNNNRILAFDVAAISDGENAINVLGQSDYTSATARTTAAGMRTPAGLSIDTLNQRLFLGDSSNNRVLVFDVRNVTDNESAAHVLGQANFTSSGASVSQTAIYQPFGVYYDPVNKYLYAIENSNHRVTVFDASTSHLIQGTVYSDEGITNIGANKTVAFSLNGSSAIDTAITNASGQFTLSGATMTGTSLVTIYLDANSEKAATVVRASGFNMSGVDLFQNQLILRTLTGASVGFTNALLATAGNNADTDLTSVYTVNSSVLNVKSGRVLRIQAPFTPGAGVRAGSGIIILNTFTPEANTIALSGAWMKRTAGTFTAGTSTVVLNGTNQSLSGATTFRNLTKTVTTSRTLTFPAGVTQTIVGTLTLQGAASNLLLLRSSSSGSVWSIDPQGTRTVNYLNVRDSTNINATDVDCSTDCSDAGNNTAWDFPVGGSSSSSSSSSSGGGTSGGDSGSSGGGGSATGGGRGRGGTPPTDIILRRVLTACTASTATLFPVTESPSGTIEMIVHGTLLRFSDVPAKEWFASFVSFVVTHNMASGYSDERGNLLGLFRPARPVTYVEFAKMLLRAKGETPSRSEPKNRIAKLSWGKGEIARAEELEWSVYTPSLDVNAPMKRGEVLQTIMEAFDIPLTDAVASYGDLLPTHPYAKAIATAIEKCIVSGDTSSDGTLMTRVRPDGELNRAELSKILQKLWELGYVKTE